MLRQRGFHFIRAKNKLVSALRDAEYFMTPRADPGSSCVEAKILRHINDALTTAITVHDIKGPLGVTRRVCVLWESNGDFSLEDYPRLDDSLRPVTIRVCGMRTGAIFTLPSTSAHPSLSSIYGALQCIWRFSTGLQPTGDPSPSVQSAPFLHRGSMREERDMAVSPSQLVANDYKHSHVQHKLKCAHRV